jgi:hypothetical protein
MKPLADPMLRRRRWWLTPPAVALLVLVLALLAVALLSALWVWGQLPRDSEDTIWVQFFPDVGPDPRAGGKGLVALAVEPGRVADPGPFAERVAALVAPAAPRLPAVVHKNRGGTMQLVDVHLEEPLVPRRLDTRAVQQALAAAGFRWLIVHLYVEERSQVLPRSAAEAGKCFGYNGLSCEWRIASGGSPLKFEVPPLPAEGRA